MAYRVEDQYRYRRAKQARLPVAIAAKGSDAAGQSTDELMETRFRFLSSAAITQVAIAADRVVLRVTKQRAKKTATGMSCLWPSIALSGGRNPDHPSQAAGVQCYPVAQSKKATGQ